MQPLYDVGMEVTLNENSDKDGKLFMIDKVFPSTSEAGPSDTPLEYFYYEISTINGGKSLTVGESRISPVVKN
jgi:hypothetical protein